MKKLTVLLPVLLLAACAQAPTWHPVGNRIMTSWGEALDPACPLQEYPRPQMVRPSWQSLNGLWDYSVTSAGEAEPHGSEGKILVPFCIESALSGVGRHVLEDEVLWYETTFRAPHGERVLLHFGAVDWSAEVWLNGYKVGSHTGGYTAFSFDITPYLGPGIQHLRVKVMDGTDNDRQPRGKQVSSPDGIWYTPVTGIWQTVWVEAVPQCYIKGYEYTADISDGTITITVDTDGGDEVSISSEGRSVTVPPGRPAVLPLEGARLWSPSDPYLYDLDIVLSEDGRETDAVKGYAALREISIQADKAGHRRMALNGKTLFHFGPLDQGWWPDGLYTAPSDEALAFDIRKTKDMGFNMIRKHIKVEPERWYWWCDRLGVLVWQDMPSITDNRVGRWDPEGYEGEEWDAPASVKKTYFKEWGEIIAQLRNHPSIVVWVPFNEGWAQIDTRKTVDFTRTLDPTRLVNPASGGNFIKGVGDILDLHHYPDPQMVIRDPALVNVLGEYGGIGWPVEGHLWQPDRNWGYVKYESGADVLAQYEEYAEALKGLVQDGCAAAVYTQTTDVEIEVNGLMTYDRKVIKMPEDKLRAVNQSVINLL